MNFGIELGTIVIEVLVMFYFYHEMLGMEQRTKKQVVFCYLSYGLVLTAGTVWVPIGIGKALPLIAISLFGNRYLYRQTWMKVTYVTAIHFVLTVLADVLCGGILLLAGLSPAEIMGSGVGRLVYNSFAKLVHLLFLQLVLTGSKRGSDSSEGLVHAIPLLLCQIASGFICYQNFFVLMEGSRTVLVVAETVCLLLINLVLCIYVELLKKFYAQREHFEAQREYYTGLMERQEETRALWHDIKKYMTAMEDLVQADKQGEARQCLDQAEAAFSAIKDTVDVGNPAVDHIISRGVKKCREQGIELRMNIWVSEQLDILASDLYIILGNTLDNAIEACRGLSEERRVIQLSMHQKNHVLCYEISNEYQGKATPRSGIHGYGLRNVRSCVARNNGYMRIEQENGTFLVSIRLEV